MWEWRSSEELCFQRKDIGRLSTQLRLLSEHWTSLEQQLTQVTQSKRKCQRRLSNYKSKWGRDVQAELGWIEEQLEECNRKIKLLTSENRELQQMVQFLNEDCDVVTFQEGKYTDNVREVYMKLLNMGVGRRNIQDVIRIILRKLAGLVQMSPSLLGGLGRWGKCCSEGIWKTGIECDTRRTAEDCANSPGQWKWQSKNLRIVCKAFQKQGSEEAILLNEKYKLTAFRGNRYNVLFWNGAAVYYHQHGFGQIASWHAKPTTTGS